MRRRVREVAIAIGIVAAVFVALFVTDAIARGRMEAIGRTVIARALDLEDSVDVDVDIDGSSALLQLALGTVDHVTATVDNVGIGTTAGVMHVEIYGLPMNEVEPIMKIYAYLELDDTELQALASELASFEVTSVEASAPDVALHGLLDLGRGDVAVTLEARPRIADGMVTLVPDSLSVDEHSYTPEQMAERFGIDPASLIDNPGLCAESVVPDLVTVDDARTSGTGLVMMFGAEQLAVFDLEAAHGRCIA